MRSRSQSAAYVRKPFTVGTPCRAGLGEQRGADGLPRPPEFGHRELGIRAPQEPFEVEFAFSPRGGKEAVTVRNVQVVKIKDRAQLDVLEFMNQ